MRVWKKDGEWGVGGEGNPKGVSCVVISFLSSFCQFYILL